MGRRALGMPGKPQLYYTVPGRDQAWVLDWVGRYIVQGINQQFDLNAQLTSSPRWLVDHILHYGSLWEFLYNLDFAHNARNKLIVTIFHGDRLDDSSPEIQRGVNRFLGNLDDVEKVVTASRIMEQRLIEWHVPETKIVRIPLGVDLKMFRLGTPRTCQELRRKFGIPQDAFCIGSFHKDGVGFDKGLEPKLIKGPDVFVNVIERLAKRHKLHVFLTAPARGYVKRGLEKIGVPYTHVMLDDFREVATYYDLLDLYLVTSREEGGPKGVLEALASGVPLVSTRVGLAPDVIEDGYNGLLADAEDVDALAQAVSRVIADSDFARDLTTTGLQTIQDYDWQVIATQYYHQVYRPVLDKLKE
jgi:glycosyltransferase involved in cell wall biosynthesis